MKLTSARLLELATTGIGAEALALYLSASALAGERGTRTLPAAAFGALPWAPRNQKQLTRALSELANAGLLAVDGTGLEVVECLSAAAKRMRRLRANRSVTGDEHDDRTEASRVTVVFGEQSANGEVAPSPTPPPVLSEGSVSSGSDSGSSSASDQRPVRKRARAAAKTPWPSDFDEQIRPRVFAWAAGERHPDWWVADRLEQMKLDCGSKGLTYSDWYLAAVGWLRREDKQYGNGPAALEARQARAQGTPPGFRQHQQQLEENCKRPELALFKAPPTPKATVSAAEFESLLRPKGTS